jgi:putative transposase
MEYRRPAWRSQLGPQRSIRLQLLLLHQHLQLDVLRRLVESTQYVSIRYSERLAEAGVEPSVGSKGDSYDNALAETINGLYKAELIHRRAPWKTKEAVEMATLEWVSWFNNHRLLEPIGYIPPAEAEANYYRQLASRATAVAA